MSNRLFKFTFEDGSEALAHYGVKGMKWGNWNADTKEKYAQEGITGGGGGYTDDEYEEVGLNKNMSREEANKKVRENARSDMKTMLDSRRKSGTTTGGVQALTNRVAGTAYEAKVASSLPKGTIKSHTQKSSNVAYKKESSANKAEFKGDRKGYAQAQARTNAYYGKSGSSAQRRERTRRTLDRMRSNIQLRKAGFKKSGSGTWRKS